MLYLCNGNKNTKYNLKTLIIMNCLGITCEIDKPCFLNKADIINYINIRNKRKGGDGFKYYKCSKCHCYHLTTHTVYGEKLLMKPERKYKRLQKKADDIRILRLWGLA